MSAGTRAFSRVSAPVRGGWKPQERILQVEKVVRTLVALCVRASGAACVVPLAFLRLLATVYFVLILLSLLESTLAVRCREGGPRLA